MIIPYNETTSNGSPCFFLLHSFKKAGCGSYENAIRQIATKEQNA
jgi:hypothetical protein